MKQISSIVTLFLIFFPPYSTAFQNEPNGFRGITFGTSIDELPYMEKIRSTQHYEVYRKKGDKLEMDGVELNEIRYMFINKKFIGVTCVYTGLQNFDKLKKILTDRHGESIERSKQSKADRDYIWYGKNIPVRIMIIYSESYNVGSVAFIYKTLKTLDK